MEKSLILKKLDENKNAVPILFDGREAVLSEFTYKTKRMSAAPTISAKFMHPTCLDKRWPDTTFVEFNKERYILKQTPTSMKSYDGLMYVHTLELISERVILENVYFYDVVSSAGNVDDKPVSNSTTVFFYGTVEEFIRRLNSSLENSGLGGKDGYVVEMEGTIAKEEKQITFEKKFFAEALQEIFNTFNVTYRFEGKRIIVGNKKEDEFLKDVIFEYGADKNLLSITKNNANKKIVTRIAVEGSEENIPYYYPNATPYGDVVLQSNSSKIEPYGDANKAAERLKLDRVLYFGTFSLKDSAESTYLKEDFKRSFYNVSEGHHPVFETVFEVWAYSNHIFMNGDAWISFKNNEGRLYVDKLLRASVILYELYQGAETAIKTFTFDKNVVLPKDYHFTAKEGRSYIIRYSAQYEEIKGKPEKSPQKIFFINVSCNGWSEYNDTDKDRKGYKQVSLHDYGIGLTHPELVATGDEIFVAMDKYINPTKRLMPPIYREKNERFYNAINGTYGVDKWENEYKENDPREHIEILEDIKPSIVGITNAAGQRIDQILDVAFDDNDDNEYEEKDKKKEYGHPYFFVKLAKTDGPNGFNLFDCAADGKTMTVHFTSGTCGAYVFEVHVSEEKNSVGKQENLVQVDAQGNLMRYKDGEFAGEVICGREGRPKIPFGQCPRQQDTQNNEVWIALRKDFSTNEGQIMPDSKHNFKPAPKKDTFVFTNIQLPEGYIKAAEARLEKAAIDFMKENNSERFTFSVNLSRIYLEKNPNVLNHLNENSKINVRYDGALYELYVDSYSYNMKGGEILPEIRIDVVDEITKYQNSIQKALSEVRKDILLQISSLDIAGICAEYFIRRDIDDEVSNSITFNAPQTFKRGFEVGDNAASIKLDESGSSVGEIDTLKVRKKAVFNSVEILESKHIGGSRISSAASCKLDAVIKQGNGFRCYFRRVDPDGNATQNLWMKEDQAFAETLNLEKQSDGRLENKRWWRKVIGTSNELVDRHLYVTVNGVDEPSTNFHFIDVSNGICEPNSDIPQAGDNVVLLGHRGTNFLNEYRCNAIFESSIDENGPYYRQYTGIRDFVLPEPDTQIQSGANRFSGRVRIEKGSVGAHNLEDLPEYLKSAIQLGGENLFRNSGFNGEYESVEMEGEELTPDKELYNPRMEYWEGDGTSEVSGHSASGRMCACTRLGQRVKLDAGVDYVISFLSSASYVGINIGTMVEHYVKQTNDGKLHTYRFKYDGEKGDDGLAYIEFYVNGGRFLIYNLKLERGTIRTDWNPSSKDNNPAFDKFKELLYLRQALRDGRTDILGGLILSTVINLGQFTGKPTDKVTAGMSGIYNDENDVAFWGGGTMQQAINTVAKYKKDPLYQPTEAELKDMAKLVFTHGGRGILNDVILRGYVYALGGSFKGSVTLENVDYTVQDHENESYDTPIEAKNGYIYAYGNYVMPELSVGTFRVIKFVRFEKARPTPGTEFVARPANQKVHMYRTQSGTLIHIPELTGSGVFMYEAFGQGMENSTQWTFNEVY